MAWTGRNLVGLLVALACTQALSTYMQKRAALVLEGYPYILALTQPMCTSTCFGLIAAVTYLLKSRQKRREELIESSVNMEKEAIQDAEAVALLGSLSQPPQTPYVRTTLAMFYFLVIGGLISLSNFLNFTGMRGNVVAGPLAVLLQQAVLPCTVLFSVLILRRVYARHEVAGVAVVLLGIAMVSVTEMLATHATAAKIVAVFLLLAAALPNALALVLMERLLRTMQVDVWWLWTWINVYEILFAFPIIFAQMAIENVPDYAAALHRGYTQFFTTTTVLWFALFILCILANKALSYLVILHNGATLNWLALAAAIPLADMLFSITPATRAQDAAWMWAVDVAALIVVVAGLFIYHGALSRAGLFAPQDI
eukprot:m.4825 g.4825  ORF g.4825 m.4825 type:complete len:369 (+) comp4397_c0_seq2:235-1341(+)